MIQESARSIPHGEADSSLGVILDTQRRAFMRDGSPALEDRLALLDRCVTMVTENQGALCEAINADFGNRPVEMTRAADFFTLSSQVKYIRKHLKRWMRPVKRRPDFPFNLTGAKGLPVLPATRRGGHPEPVERPGRRSHGRGGRRGLRFQSGAKPIFRSAPARNADRTGFHPTPVWRRMRAFPGAGRRAAAREERSRQPVGLRGSQRGERESETVFPPFRGA